MNDTNLLGLGGFFNLPLPGERSRRLKKGAQENFPHLSYRKHDHLPDAEKGRLNRKIKAKKKKRRRMAKESRRRNR